MKIEVVGGPFDGRYFEIADDESLLSVPIMKNNQIYEFGSDILESFIPTFKIATMPVHDNNKVYWGERNED